MTAYTHDGRILHHNNCTYCIYRRNLPLASKGRKKPLVMEICTLHENRQIPAPFMPGRSCDEYVQKGCECKACSTKNFADGGIFTNQLVDTIDKGEQPC